MHTSEDNASYNEIVQEEASKAEEKASSLYAPSLEYKPDLAAIGCKSAVIKWGSVFSVPHYFLNHILPNLP